MVTINTTDDLLRALAEKPSWKEAVRREILTEELLKLPARFERFVATTEAFMAEQRQINANTTEFIAEQRQINAEQKAIQRQHHRIHRRAAADQRRTEGVQRADGAADGTDAARHRHSAGRLRP